MTATFIRYYFIIFCSIFTYYKLLNIKSNIQAKYTFIISVISALLLSFFNNITIPKIPLLFSSFFLIIFLFSNVHFIVKFTTSLIAFTISYISLTISGCIICIFLLPFSESTSIIFNNLLIAIGGLLQYSFIKILFKTKRLQNGMPFLKKASIFHKGICSISLIAIYFLFILPSIKNNFFPLNFLTMLFIPILAIALLIWWRRKITQSYVEKLRVSEVETLYKEISDKNLEIEKLRANNEQLAGIIHKDNKLIPAMELAVRNYLQTATLMKPEDAQQMGTDLLAKLERMSEERTGIIRTYQEANSYRQRCGLASIDAIVDYMENRATELGIEYHYQYDKGIKEMLPAYIGEDDAMHLLSDVIENAIIASNHNEKKTVHIHIGFIQSTLFMDISDSGIPFDPETYQNLGMLQHTTHKEHGGSGIGLMDLGKLKKQYKFSLHIYEYPETEPVYTKKIRILFDKKNHYLIQSYRAGEIRTAITRNDLHIFQYTDTQNEFPTLDDKSKRFT